MNIEIKPFIHQTCFTPQLVWRPLKKKFPLTKACRPAWLTDQRREATRRTTEATRFFKA